MPKEQRRELPGATPPLPRLFVSHGTALEAKRSQSLAYLRRWKEGIGAVDAVIVVSAHWETDTFSVSADARHLPLDEGFPRELSSLHSPPGAPLLAAEINGRLANIGYPASMVTGRGLDHGATLVLSEIDPSATVPTVQLSLPRTLDDDALWKTGEALAPLSEKGVLLIGSGGAVHNRSRIAPPPDDEQPTEEWAMAFEAKLRAALAAPAPLTLLKDLREGDLFPLAHPTDEHFRPLLIVAGGGSVAKPVHVGFQWQNLSMLAVEFGGYGDGPHWAGASGRLGDLLNWK